MRIKLLLVLLTTSFVAFSQDSIVIRKPDTLLPFFGTNSLRLHGYENRIVPYNSPNPLYVLISYNGVDKKHFEYFRIDSSKYLVNEFFSSKKGSSNDGLKASGIVHVIDKILDSSTSYGRSVSGGGGSKQTHYYKGFSKEGEWTEYEDSVFNHKYWTGTYLNNRKVGIWSNYIYDPNDDRLIQQIDYDKDATKKIFTTNTIGQLSIDSISYYLLGRWPIGYDPSDDERNLMMKCQLYDGNYGDDCNSRFGKIDYFEFLKNGKFLGQNGELNKHRTIPKSGFWKVSNLHGKIMLEISSADKRRIRYDIIYLDREGNMVADRK